MEIRPIREEEREQAFYLMSQAFMQGDRDMSWLDRPRPPYASFGVWDDAGMQAKVTVLSYHIHVGPQVVVPMGGIAGVACLPASRGKGYAGAGLKYALERMREAGQVVSTLFPFSWDYYRNLGWEWVGMRRTYVVATRALRSDPETERVRAAAPADRNTLVDVYTRFAGRYRGMLKRHELHWDHLLNDDEKQFTYTYLYESADGPEGYLTYRGGKGEETWLREFICLTPRAQRALLGLLRRLEMQVSKFRWSAPSDDTLWNVFYHWDIETTVRPMTQGRVVDVPGALQALTPESPAGSAVTLAVEDACAPWNAGTWRVEFEDGRVAVRRTDETPQVTMDIQALTQAWFGTPTVDNLRAAGRMTVHDEAGYGSLRSLFAGPPMWMNDDF